jgi:hypothetical protein
VRTGIWIGERQPADNAAHEADLARDIEAFLCLTVELMQHLDENGAFDAAARKLGAKVIGGEIPRQPRSGIWRPRVCVPARPQKW